MDVRLTSVHYAVGESIEMCCGVRFTSVHYTIGESIEMC